jgi:hypothetical protein
MEGQEEVTLNPISLSDKTLFEKYLNINKYINSEYSFVTWYAWQGLYAYRYAIIENCLCVFGRISDMGFINFPLGEKADVKNALLRLIEYFGGKGKRLVLMSVSDVMLGMLGEMGLLEQFKIEPERDRADYICRRENFTHMAGKKLHGKRNHYNYFADTYDAYLTPITDDLVPACRKMLAEIIEDRSTSPNAEYSVTDVILRDRDALNLKGAVLLADNHPIGVILGECRGGNTIIHIAKADINYRGASVALFKLFLDNNFTECEYVNLMDDMGIDGLRKSKLAWRPEWLACYNILTLTC